MSGRARYLGFAITVALLALLVWKIDLHEVEVALVSANYVWVIPAIGCTLSSYLLRTLRWSAILRPIRPLSFRTLLPVVMIGFMANNLLPARMGELVRAYALGRKTGLSKSLGLATILLERLCDGVTLIVVLGLVAFLYPLPAEVREAGYIASAVFLAGTIGAFILLTRQRLALRFLALLIRPLPRGLGERIQLKAASFIEGLRVLRRGGDLLLVAGWSLIIWGIEATSYLLVLRGIHPTLPSGTPVLAALLMMVLVNLSSLIPSAPGYVGVFQAAGVMALGAFGVPSGVALAVAIVAHASQWVTVTTIGLAFTARESLSLGGLAADTGVPDRAAAYRELTS